MWKLIDVKTQAEVSPGDTLSTFRGETCFLESWEPPHKPSSTGRITVRFTADESQFVQSFYPTVCGLKIIEVTEAGTPYPAIKIGDVVKSYDFPDNKDCYVVGQVVAIGLVDICERDCKRYSIRPIYRVWDRITEALQSDRLIYPPVNGTPTTLGGVTSGVEPFWS